MVFGILSIVGGFLALPLPETRHHPLPESIDDVEHYEEFCRYVCVCACVCVLACVWREEASIHDVCGHGNGAPCGTLFLPGRACACP